MSVISELIRTTRSGIFSVNFYIDNQPVSSGSGFIYKGYLVSNSHVFNPDGQPLPADAVASFRFGDTTQFGNDDFRVSYRHLKLVVGSTEDSHDYCVYQVPDGVGILGRYSYELDQSLAYEGQQILLMGYPFNSKYMSSHVGYISALYDNGGIPTIQLDASVNAGNSGGPLIDIETGKVMGIVTRKHTGLSEQFDELIKSFNNNITALDALKGMLVMGGVDQVDILQVSQRQMQRISKDIRRSANVGIGYAFSTASLQNESL